MRDRVYITGVYVDRVDIDEAMRLVASFVEEKREVTTKAPAIICTPNAEIMMEAQSDTRLKGILNSAEMVIADGAGVVLASKILGCKPPLRRTPGYDLVKRLLSNSAESPFSFYLLGGKPGVAETAAEKLMSATPSLKIAGFCDGYFSEESTPKIIEQINASGAEILLVALGAPKQEKWMYDNKSLLNPAVCIGIGGSLDVLAGKVALAPDFFRNNGLEWLYRLFKEPRRLRRMLRLPKYVLFTLYWRLFRRSAAT